MENITHPKMDSTIRTMGLRLPKGGGPTPLTIPVQQELARKPSRPYSQGTGPPIS